MVRHVGKLHCLMLYTLHEMLCDVEIPFFFFDRRWGPHKASVTTWSMVHLYTTIVFKTMRVCQTTFEVWKSNKNCRSFERTTHKERRHC